VSLLLHIRIRPTVHSGFATETVLLVSQFDVSDGVYARNDSILGLCLEVIIFY